MATSQTKDLLDIARGFHQRLGDLYEKMGLTAEDEKVGILLDYLSRHERHLQEVFEHAGHDVRDEVRDRWFKYLPGENPLRRLNELTFPNDLDADALANLALELDGAMVEWFRDVATRSSAPSVRAVFEQLLQLEKSEQVQLARDSLELADF